MTTRHRHKTAIALLVLAAALVSAAQWLMAGPDAEPRPPSVSEGEAPQAAPASTTPLPDFKPSEELPADAAVAFPTDI